MNSALRSLGYDRSRDPQDVNGAVKVECATHAGDVG
jgi:hypothetical protein